MSRPLVYSAIAFSYCWALKNLLPAALKASASASISLDFGADVEADLCGGGGGAASSVFWLLMTPFAAGNAPGAEDEGLDGVLCSPPIGTGSPAAAIRRRSWSGGRLRGCEPLSCEEDLWKLRLDRFREGLDCCLR